MFSRLDDRVMVSNEVEEGMSNMEGRKAPGLGQ